MEVAAALLFPGLPKRPWKEVNLNEAFVKLGGNSKLDMKSLKDQNTLLDQVAQPDDCYTSGGFGEDRTALWDGFEKDAEKMVHLGVDLNQLSVGQPVTTPMSGQVVHIMKDDTKFNGWGGRVILKCQDGKYVLMGHLNPEKLPRVKDELKSGAIVGYVGAGDVNGGWFPHLHLQVMTPEYVESFGEGEALDRLDGYDFHGNLQGLIDPIKWLLRA